MLTNEARHITTPIWVRADVDVGIAELVQTLNRNPNLRTFTSCQGGDTYGPYVMVGWLNAKAFRWLAARYVLESLGDGGAVDETFPCAYIRVDPNRPVSLLLGSEGGISDG